MPLLDDPMLALITRFVAGESDHLNVSDEQYLQDQLVEIRRHVEAFPEEQRQQAALDWIAEHAERYRMRWQQQKLSDLVIKGRCRDCPLCDDGSRSNCMIHKRWVGLLKEYIDGDISSERYLQETLRLLNEHKGSLKVALAS